MKTAEMFTHAELREALSCFTHTEIVRPHWSGKFFYSDGVRFLAEYADAYWLLDVIASHLDWGLFCQPLQVWTLTVFRQVHPAAGKLECRLDEGKPVIRRHLIDYVDFPLDSMKLWLYKGMLMLRSEY